MKILKKYRRDAAVCLLIFVILYLFYKSFIVIIFIPPCYFFYRKYHKKKKQNKEKEVLDMQFKDFLISLSAALRAGFSAENAIKEALAEMKVMHGEASPIYRELTNIVNSIALGERVETAFNDFAERTQSGDIRTFASVFAIAKKTGGDLVSVIKSTADSIAEKNDVKSEISVMVSAKKFEQKIMNIMPLAVLAYINLTSVELAQTLYKNAAGVAVMTVCLLFYAAAFFISERIMDIKIQ